MLTARLWDAAWEKGHGADNIVETAHVPEAQIRKLYQRKEGFLDSVGIDDIASEMTWPPRTNP